MQEYLQDAENYHFSGNEAAAFASYMVAANEYDLDKAQYEVAVRYQNGSGVEMRFKKN